MPIYEYACRKCGAEFEHLARTLVAKAPECPICGSARTEKQLSVFSASVKSAPSAAPCGAAAHQCRSAGCCGGGGKCPVA